MLFETLFEAVSVMDHLFLDCYINFMQEMAFLGTTILFVEHFDGFIVLYGFI